MSIQYIEIDTAQLNADIGELKANISKAKGSLESMKSELDQLNVMWTGKANMAFRSQVTKDYNLMTSMLATMEKLAECMENAKREYTRCEQSVKNTVNSIQI